jgi:hypothetical protein
VALKTTSELLKTRRDLIQLVCHIQVDGAELESFNKKEKKKKSQDNSASPVSTSEPERSPPLKRSQR